MDTDKLLLIAWSYGLAGLLYTVFPIGLITRGYLRAPRDLPSALLLLALFTSAAWAWLLFAGAFQEQALLLRLATLADILRYGAWFWFIQTLLRARSGQAQPVVAGARHRRDRDLKLCAIDDEGGGHSLPVARGEAGRFLQNKVY